MDQIKILTSIDEAKQIFSHLSKVIVYTDGCCKGNPGPGCSAAIFVVGDEIFGLRGLESDKTTNNQQELSAVIMALKCLATNTIIDLHTDSKYVQNGITNWIHGWKRKGWRKADGKPVLNLELWKQLDELSQQHQITYHWVAGHSGHAYNDMADRLCQV